jgi:hypothetical protein
MVALFKKALNPDGLNGNKRPTPLQRETMAGQLIFALLAALALATGALPTAALAQPNFSASRGEVEPANPRAGDVVRHVFTITNTGSTVGPVHISTSVNRGFLIGIEGDCAGTDVDSSGGLTWHQGAFHNGETRRCTVIMLTRSNAAGTYANVVTEIRVIPSGYFRVEARAELGNPIDPHAVRVGPVMMTRAGMIVTAIFVLLIVGAAVIKLRSLIQPETPLGQQTSRQSTGILLGSWAAVLIASGFLAFFVALAREDWRAYGDYRETRCTVFGSETDSFERRSRSGDQGPSYKPVFAVRYLVDGIETYSTGYTTGSAFNFNSRAGAGSVFERFAVGTSHTCWYDPQDPKTVLLVRGPGGAYFLGLLPIPVLLIGLDGLTGAWRRRRREAASGAGITHPKIGE